MSKISRQTKSGDTIFQRYLAGGYEYTWSDGMIQKILRNQTYIGDMVNVKTQVISYKTKKSIHNKKDKYIIVPNTHEAIIDRNNFERVQNLCKQRHNPRKIVNIENIFKGLVKCSVRGRNIVLTTQNRYGKRVLQYRCNTFVSTRIDEKHWVTIKYDDI